MPLLGGDMEQFNLGKGGFGFTGARFDKLVGAASYTLATIAIDCSGSVDPFRQQLVDMAKTVVEACRKSPHVDSIMIRVIYISDRFSKGVEEAHGFALLKDIDVAVYDKLRPGGMTPLIDGCYSAIGATNAYAAELKARDYDSNAIVLVITDGAENASVTTAKMLKHEIERAVTSESLESLISILIGINSDHYDAELTRFQQDCGLAHYKKAGEATARNLAKLAGFVSTSVSSQAQGAAGTGGPSQNIAATI